MRRGPISLLHRFTLCLALAMSTTSVARAQDPLAPVRPSGLSVTPAFEGWYKNPDGSYSISFGYFNRNSKETLEIPVGPDNNITPGDANQGQPTHFDPRRNWGVFTVIVPADFGKKKVTWNLKNRGESYAISGSLDPLWQIDALEGEAGSDNTPPALKLSESGPEGRGPGGVSAGPVKAKAGVAIPLQVWSRDDGHSAAAATTVSRDIPVTLTWLKHQGAGDVTFSSASARVPNAGGSATTYATFSAPGDYIIRVRANDASGIAGAGHAQCCWSNAFIRVTVTP